MSIFFNPGARFPRMNQGKEEISNLAESDPIKVKKTVVFFT